MSESPQHREVSLTDTLQIGRAGELLVSYRLLRLGIESAPMTTDRGVDIVAFDAAAGRALTLQVKTVAGPKPAGGTGKPSLDWWVASKCPADLVALVELSGERIWLFSTQELGELAQQHSARGYHLYMYLDSSVRLEPGKRARVEQFEEFLLEGRVDSVFTVQSQQ